MDSTLVIETYNVLEGTSLESVRRSLRIASEFRAPDGGFEILLADVTGDPTIRALLDDEFPGVRFLDATGLGYCAAKRRAAEAARGRYVIYLDCDCVPDPGWWEQITARLRDGSAIATGGFASYPGGFSRKLQSLLDFGFLIPRQDRALGCYASNNSAFVRTVLLEVPEPEGPMRCRCYAHAQLLARKGCAAQLVAEAAVEHEPPPVLRERLRQGYDMVAACWVDSDLPEARWLRYRVLATPLYYGRRVKLDYTTLYRHRNETGLSRPGAMLAVPLILMWRLVDAVGMLAALACGPRAGRWFFRA